MSSKIKIVLIVFVLSCLSMLIPTSVTSASGQTSLFEHDGSRLDDGNLCPKKGNSCAVVVPPPKPIIPK